MLFFIAFLFNGFLPLSVFFWFLLLLSVFILNINFVHGGIKRNYNSSEESVTSPYSLESKTSDISTNSTNILINDLNKTKRKPPIRVHKEKNKQTISLSQNSGTNASNTNKKSNYEKNLLNFETNLLSDRMNKIKIAKTESRPKKMQRTQSV
ncbi:hypothetical protein Mgra_00009557 [Meloidogyne graminicola]|uniref:Uncharacterized protein n=1 Tax=Meloidogyne graminicola TaxID=189291 RepID=A0A8S9Z7J4_9BILA|nr:hypothetical protein Mgra_00009557 [Meloidogyne graminicola]